jgi:hypothetical protein
LKESKFLTIASRLANAVLAAFTLACLVAFAYSFYYYAYTGQRQFTSWKGTAVYYFLPLLLAIASLIPLHWPAPRKISLALLLSSIGISVFLVESLMTLWFGLPTVSEALKSSERAKVAMAQGVQFDNRSKREVAEDLRRHAIDAVPAVFPKGLPEEQPDGSRTSPIRINGVEVLPLSTISNKLNVVCKENGPYVMFQSDQHGFNNPPKVWNNTSVDVLAVGDSFTQIYCLPPEQIFVSLIRRRYSATVNLGIEGNGPLCELGTIKEFAPYLKPKVVLWFYYEGNDLNDLISESRTTKLTSYLDSAYTQDLFNRQPEIDAALLAYLNNRKEKSLTRMELEDLSKALRHPGELVAQLPNVIKLSQLRLNLGLVDSRKLARIPTDREMKARAAKIKPMVDLFSQVLSEAKRSVREWGGTLYFVYLPDWSRYAPESAPNPDRDAALAAAASVGLPIIDVHQAFIAQKDPLDLFPFRQEGHYTEEGNRIVADYVLSSFSIPSE